VELGPEAALAAATVCEERGALERAALLYLAAGDCRRAATAFERGGFALEAAIQLEEAGEARRAIELYRVHLAQVEETGAAGAPPAARDGRYRLGRLLLRFGRPAEALPLLQRAWREEGAGAGAAGRACVAALARLGHQRGARYLLSLIAASDPAASWTVESCCDDPALTPAGGAEDPASQGRTLAGRYRLGKLLGSGGMGRVYQAIDLLSEARVAVKIFTAPSGARGRDAYRRFLREAETTGRLQHPQIVALLDVHEEMGFMVLEHMAGGNLADRLRPRLDLGTARTVLLQVCAGLAAAHQRGVVHRDLKPTNIFFTDAGAAKLGDFGVAHLQDSGQTQTGAFIGTVAFMSPEQIVGDRVTFATDLYALGINLYLMLTGELPFAPPDLVSKHLSAPPPRLSELRPELPPICDEIVQRCLAKRPGDRHESLDALRSELERIPVEPRSPSLRSEIDPGGSDAAGPRRRASDRRFAIESTLLETPEVQALSARDGDLGRAVVLVRVAPGPGRDSPLGLLTAAAAAGDEHLQRVFTLDRERGQATLEARLGEPGLSPPAEGDDRRVSALRVAEQLGLALDPLHAAGIPHGAISADAVSHCGPHLILSLVAALDRSETGTPSDDVRAVLVLCGLQGGPAPTDGAALVGWARAERERVEADARRERIRVVLARATADAPPGVRR
jgi:serine/threonine-protein kinase